MWACPMISVVVPAFNEESLLAQCLDSLKKQSYRDFEIIVVAGGNDRTSAIAKSFGTIVVSQDQKGIAKARQKGFSVARGEIIASTDADAIVPEDWLHHIQDLFERHPAAISIAGHFQLYDGPSFVRFWIKISLILMPVILKTAPWLWNFGGANFAVKTETFNKLGGFDLNRDFGEDIDLCRRLRKYGKVIFAPSLVVRVSGRAFAKDKLGLKSLINYLGVLFRGRHLLSVSRVPDADRISIKS